MPDPNNIRIDKWLWSVRLYKTRTQATKACDAGQVKIDGEKVKASRVLRGGETIEYRKDHNDHIVEVVKLIDKRVGAPIAIECYIDKTPAGEDLNKVKHMIFKFKDDREKGSGRPTKKERRQIRKLRDR